MGCGKRRAGDAGIQGEFGALKYVKDPKKVRKAANLLLGFS
jgi:hypothetical protein